MKTGKTQICCIIVFFSLLILSCNNNQPETKETSQDNINVETPEFDSILNNNNVSGSILIYDYYDNKYYSNDFEHCNQGYLPASTFKIANSLIGLETGIVDAYDSIFYWNGEDRAFEIWEQDLNLHDAFHYSCVPCYQELANKIGAERMNEYLEKLKYGNMKVDSSNIDIFWLEGESKITQFEQVDFLKRLYFEELPVSIETMQTLKELMIIESDDYSKLSGKTGWVTRNGENTGWFVGYYEMNDKVWFVATNIQPEQEFNMDLFPVIRKEISMDALYFILAETEEFIYFEF